MISPPSSSPYTFLIDKRKEDELDDEHVEELKDIVKKHEKKEPPKQAPNKINEFLKELKKQNLVVEGSASKKDIEEFTKNKNVISFQKNNPDAFETDMLQRKGDALVRKQEMARLASIYGLNIDNLMAQTSAKNQASSQIMGGISQLGGAAYDLYGVGGTRDWKTDIGKVKNFLNIG